MTAVALGIITHNRPEELQQAVASARSQDWEELWVVDMGSTPPVPPIEGVSWVRFEENEGYCAGRNHVATKTDADVIVFLDDDAMFLRDDAAAVVRTCFGDDTVGATAAKIQRPGGEIAPVEFPFRGGVSEPDRARACAYFVGACHAVRVSLWRTIGGLDTRFFFSTEEIDMSLEILKRGYTIRYEPTLVIEHRPSPRGRVHPSSLPAMLLRNRIILARRHLPALAAACFILAWGVRTLLHAIALRGTRRWLAAWSEGFRAPTSRNPISWRLVREIHRLGGRTLW